MASPSPPASSPTRQPSTRSPSASMSNNTYTSTTSSTPSKQHHHHQHHGHLPVGHSIHSPAHSATGEAIQGRPSEAGGLHTSTSRGNILVPPPSSSTSNTPADLLSVISSTTSNPSLASSRPSSPAVLSTPNSPVLQLRSSSSRPTSPCRSPNNTKQDFDTMSNSTTPQLDSSAIFERDAEFATEHLLTGSEAIDLAAAPILSEVALAVISNDPSPASSAILGGGGVTENMTQSLDSTLFSSPSAKLPSNAIIPGNNDSYNHQGNLISNNEPSTSNIPLSERLRHSSPSPARGPSARGTYTTSTSEGTGEGEFSPPPSLSLSPSATGSPISSTPGSPIQPLHYPSSSLIGTGGDGAGGNAVNTTSTSGPFGHNLNDGGAPVMGLDVGDASSTSAFITSGNALPSPPASAISGISLSGNKDSGKRRLSMIRYVPFSNVSQQNWIS